MDSILLKTRELLMYPCSCHGSRMSFDIPLVHGLAQGIARGVELEETSRQLHLSHMT